MVKKFFNNLQLNVDLFRAKNYESHVFGTDSLALDIMRSRDHGLTGYVHYLNLCRHADRRSVVMLFTWADVEYMFSAKVSRTQLIM